MITHVRDDVSRQDPGAKKDKQSHEIEMQFAALEGQQKELAAALEDPAAYSPGGQCDQSRSLRCVPRSCSPDGGMEKRQRALMTGKNRRVDES
jgi:hypothetical protein